MEFDNSMNGISRNPPALAAQRPEGSQRQLVPESAMARIVIFCMWIIGENGSKFDCNFPAHCMQRKTRARPI